MSTTTRYRLNRLTNRRIELIQTTPPGAAPLTPAKQLDTLIYVWSIFSQWTFPTSYQNAKDLIWLQWPISNAYTNRPFAPEAYQLTIHKPDHEPSYLDPVTTILTDTPARDTDQQSLLLISVVDKARQMHLSQKQLLRKLKRQWTHNELVID